MTETMTNQPSIVQGEALRAIERKAPRMEVADVDGDVVTIRLDLSDLEALARECGAPDPKRRTT